MHRRDIPIANPCHEDFGRMRADDPERRHCDRCNKHVHDLSALSEREARELLAAEGRICVRYLVRPDSGELVFRPEPTLGSAPRTQRQGLKRLVAAAAILLPLGLGGGCDDDVPKAQARMPIAIEQTDGKARLQLEPKPGAPLKVAPPSEPEPCVGEPEAAPDVVMEQGEPMMLEEIGDLPE